MSWQLASAVVLLLGLAAGFGWYERSRPDTRVVALVATLAALAALGRIAFAALPNVKPTSVVVLVAGYALGPGPGAAVGAIAGLTSNFFFGQGPWTPWQMGAWAATGLLGALLARMTGGRIGRTPLAAVCFVSGFAFTVLQDLGDWVNFSDHSLRSLGAYVGQGLGFDLVYAVGCAGFALVIGPALLHAVHRFTTRLTVTWLPAGGLGTVLAVAALTAAGLAAGLAGPPPAASAAGGPVAYLRAAQHADGGLGGAPGQPSDPLFSGWAALGLAAAGENPADVRHGGASLLGYIATHAVGLPDVGAVERTVLAAAAAGADPRNFGGEDLVATLRRHIRPDGSVAHQVNLTAFAVLALRGAGAPVPGRMTGWLAAQQDRDGGFNFAGAGGQSDVDDTGAALEALGARPGVAPRAVRFLRRAENRDGGFPSNPGGASNAQSTAFAVQGLIAAGAGGATGRPIAYLRSLSVGDGHIRYAAGTDQTPVWVTGQALMALVGSSLPLAAVPRAGRHTSAPATPAVRRAAPLRARPAPAHSAGGPHRAATPGHHARGGGLDRLASAAGLLAAVVYAPIGI